MTLTLRLLVLLVVSTFMLEAGLTVPAGAMRSVRAGALLRGIFVMLILGPLAAVGMAELFSTTPRVTVALVLLSVAGVVPVAARRGRSSGGDMAYGLVLTIVLGVLAPLTAVQSAAGLLRYTGEIAFDPRVTFVQLVVVQVAPLALGVLIRRSNLRVENVIRVVHVINLLAMLGVLAVLVPRFGAMLEVGWRGLGASVALSVALAALAYVFGGSRAGERNALVGIANAPNVALALAIATSAGAKPSMSVLLLGNFLIRFLAGGPLGRVIARRSSKRSGPSVPPRHVPA
jgi:predicted Na+-dependent transporter